MAGHHALRVLDEQPLQRFHLRAMITTGMGVFTDGYDLSSIGVVPPLVLASFGIAYISSVASGMLAGSANSRRGGRRPVRSFGAVGAQDVLRH